MHTPSESGATVEPEHSPWAGLQLRFVSAAALLAVFLTAEILGGTLFTGLVLIAAMLMIREWDRLCASESRIWRAAGLLYAAVPCIALIWLRGLEAADAPDAGLYLVLFLLLCVSATDIGAYFAGKTIGGPRLAPRISPNKTWAGLAGGMLAASVCGGLGYAFTPYPSTPVTCGFAGMLLALSSQAGDLFESWLKRRAGVKDSGALIPGHGGLLDRIDELVTATPVFALLVAVFWQT